MSETIQTPPTDDAPPSPSPPPLSDTSAEATGLSPQLLPFAFARRFGVAITPDTPNARAA